MRQPSDRDRFEDKHVRTGGWWGSLIRAGQGNFDHLMGGIRVLVNGHNALVDDVRELQDFVNELSTLLADHTHEVPGEGGELP